MRASSSTAANRAIVQEAGTLGLRTQHHPAGLLQRLLEAVEGSVTRTAFVHGTPAYTGRLDHGRASVRRSLAGELTCVNGGCLAFRWIWQLGASDGVGGALLRKGGRLVIECR